MFKISKLPCIKDKCLLFPSCKNKETIDCYKLVDYITNVTPIYNSKSIIFYIFRRLGIILYLNNKIRNTFINMIRLYSSNKKNSFIFIYPYYKEPILTKGIDQTTLLTLMTYARNVKDKERIFEINELIPIKYFKKYKIKKFVSTMISLILVKK